MIRNLAGVGGVDADMHRSFAVTWDYRCPFARNIHEHVVKGLEGGAPWSVEFVPFSLSQVHVAEGEVDAWDDPSKASSLLAMQAGIVVRDTFPERFPAAHLALFAARHDLGEDVRERSVIAATLDGVGVDAREVFTAVDSGWPLATFRKEHDAAADRYHVWGVPTFFAGDEAAFVRVMDRPGNDTVKAQQTIDRILDLLTGWPDLNEFKHTSVRR